jgi:hypothetical protein
MHGEGTVLKDVKQPGSLGRTIPGVKRSVCHKHQGSEANITEQADEVTNVRYRPFPEGSGA